MTALPDAGRWLMSAVALPHLIFLTVLFVAALVVWALDDRWPWHDTPAAVARDRHGRADHRAADGCVGLMTAHLLGEARIVRPGIYCATCSCGLDIWGLRVWKVWDQHTRHCEAVSAASSGRHPSRWRS